MNVLFVLLSTVLHVQCTKDNKDVKCNECFICFALYSVTCTMH